MNKGFFISIFLSAFICAGFVSQTFAMDSLSPKQRQNLKLNLSGLKTHAQKEESVSTQTLSRRISELELSRKSSIEQFIEACEKRDRQKLENCLEKNSADLSFLEAKYAIGAFWDVIESESWNKQSVEGVSREVLFVMYALSDQRASSFLLGDQKLTNSYFECIFLTLCANKCLNMLIVLFKNKNIRKTLNEDLAGFALKNMCEDEWKEGINFFMGIREFRKSLKWQILFDNRLFLEDNLGRGRTMLRDNMFYWFT